MWQCRCGCMGIAHGLTVCPMCGGSNMPAISRSGGPTNNPEVTRQEPAAEPAPVQEAESAPAKDQEKPAEKPATGKTGKTGK